MGQTYDLACHDCKVRLWIGQTNASSTKPWIYTADASTMKALNEFLVSHLGHRLEFDVDFAFMGRDELEEGCQDEGYKAINQGEVKV